MNEQPSPLGTEQPSTNPNTPPLISIQTTPVASFGTYSGGLQIPPKHSGLKVALFISGILAFIGILVALAFVVTKSVQKSQQTQLTNTSVVIIGNSFTSRNQMPSSLLALLNTSRKTHYNLTTITNDGYSLHDHFGDSAEMDKFSQGLDGSKKWDVIILQEQSQTVGFDVTDTDHINSLAAVDYFAKAASTIGARLIIVNTWGYQSGDSTNRDIYPTYTAMQTRLNSGAEMLKTKVLAGYPQLQLVVSPVGTNWASLMTAGFSNELYASDGQHPSVFGSILEAATIAKSIDETVNWDATSVMKGVSADQRKQIVSLVK